MKISSTRLLVRIAAIALAPVILVYVGYWLYLARNSLSGFSAESEAFRRVREALLESKVGQQRQIAVGLAGIDGPDVCSFWTFEAVRSHCTGVSVAVSNFEESDREKITDIARYIAEGLAQPCQHVDLVRPRAPPRSGMAPVADQGKIRTDLGCGTRTFSYRVRVQVFTGKFVADPSGGGRYDNRHIYTHSLLGEIK